MANKKESLSTIAVKTLLAVIIFTGVGTIIVGGGLLIGNYGKTTDNKTVKPIDETNKTGSWQTYSNPEASFTFSYPDNWEVEDYEYKSLACQADPKRKGLQVVELNKIGGAKIISINMPQCSGVKWGYDLPDGNWICLFDENPE